MGTQKVKVKLLSHVQLFVTPWAVAYEVPPFMGFSRQEYWSGLPFPSPGDLSDPGIEPRSSTSDADSIPESGRSPGEGNGNPLQYSCLENSVHKGAWQATVHGFTKELDTTERLN